MKNLLLTVASLLIGLSQFAQTVDISSVVPQEMTVCGSLEQFQIKLNNDSNVAITNLSFTIDLPTGIAYVASSVVESTNSNVQEQNISNTNTPVFSADNLAAGDSIVFTVSFAAGISSINFQQQGNIFRNDVTVNYNSKSKEHTSNAYNVLYAALSITQLTPSSQTIISGDTTTRTITIVNAGNGRLSTFKLTDIRNLAGIDFIASNLGTVNSTMDTLTLSGADFSTIGNGDQYFNTNESITITQTLTASGCNSITVTSTIQTLWGCYNESRISTNSYGHITINLRNPNLNVSATAELSSCFATEKSNQELTITNNGQGYAANVVIDIFKSTGGSYNQNIFSALDPTSFTYQYGTNGAPVGFTPTTSSTRNDGAYACLGASPIGRAIYTLPFSIAPGTTIIIKWKTFHCCISECDNEKLMGWRYQVDYEDVCASNTYSKSGSGEGTTSLNMSVFTETPTDIRDGQTLPFIYTISSHDNNLPEGDGANYKVILDLPAGINWAGGVNDLTWTSSPTSWTATNVSFNSGTRQLTASFEIDAPFTIEKSEIKVNLTGDCSGGATAGDKVIDLNIGYVPDTNCASCVVEMVCNSNITTKLHCPLANCEGFRFLSFEAERINFGQPDNDANGLADASGSIDNSKIKTNRLMYGDTLQTTYSVFVDTGANNARFYNFFLESDIELGQNLSLIDGSIEIYDDVTNTQYTCTNFNTSIVNGANNSRAFRHSFLPNFDCNTLPATPGYGGGFYFTHGDSITFTVRYKVTGNIGGAVEEITINNDLFSSSLSSPWGNPGLSSDKWACDDFDGNVTLIGFYFENSSSNNYSVTSCTRTVRQDYYLSIGDCCDNYHGGNLFPYEYRNWAHVKEVEIQVPIYYQVNEVYFNQRRTETTNKSKTQTVRNLVPFHNSGGTMNFNLEQHFKPHGGTIEYSDDGFRGTVFMILAPTCDVPVNTYEDITWKFKFEQADIIGGGTTNWYTESPDRIRYNPTNLSLSSDNPIVDGLGRTVNWNLKVTNTTSNSTASNSWIHFRSPSEDLEVKYVIDNSNGDTLSLTSDFYAIGTVNTSSTRSFSIIATYSGCEPDQLIAYSGYECAGYPSDFAHFKCPYSTFGLNVEPKTAEPQVTISGKTIGGTCSNTIEVTLEVASVKFAHVDSIEIDITAIGNSLTFIPGSGELKYPLSGSFQSVADPVANGGGSTYKVLDLNAQMAESALPGVLDLNNNRFQLRFQMNIENSFTPGDYVQLSTRSKNICGSTLPTISLAYDPSVQFNENTAAGLSNDVSDSWGISWGDYDNDGYDDLYVAEYNVNKPSYLYHNNGDGTFTKNTSGIVVTDLGSSIAGTWGDYDNDGLLDLFVANNTGAFNALYKNNGGGSFTKITTGAIANHGGYCHGASWVDYDADGYLDLFVTDYMPTKFNLLYKNNGDGTFNQITNSVLVQEAKYAIGATWADYDDDGDMDVFVPATNGQSNSLFRNNGNGSFEKMTGVGIPTDAANSVGCSWGDYDNDMDLDLFVCNTSGQNNFLYQNDGDGTFTQITTGVLVTDGGHSSSSNWIDFDNDGDLDLYVCNDQSDANALYINNGNGNFLKSESPLSEDLGNSYSHAWSDYDNDGDMDLLVGNHSDERNVFFQNNRANCNAWACMKLTGVNSNRNAVGAKIRVKANIYGTATWQLKEISAQTGGGAGSQNSLKALFGLGDATIIDSIIVDWPSGFQQVLTNKSINGCIDILEGNGVQVCGTVFHDPNQDCVKGAAEKGIPGVLVKATPGERYTTTDENGNYQFFLEEGDYVISHTPSNGWTSTCTFPNGTGYQLSVDSGQTYCGNDFGVHTTCTDPDLNVSLGTTAHRRGFRNAYSIVYGNAGAYDAYNVTLDITFDNEIVPISCSTPWSSTQLNDSTTTYTWNLDTVRAFSYVDLSLIDSISLSGTMGKSLTVQASITSSGDCDTTNNIYSDINPIVGAVDPNDLTVYPAGIGTEGYIEKTQDLRYKIRFQNVGSYYAQNVIVTNVLPEGIDMSTLHDFHSSHKFTVSTKGQTVVFRFDNIHLPDSGRNEEKSNGFIEFKAYPETTIHSGALIPNQADIVFDFEDPLSTNKVLNTIKFNISGENTVLIEPNPAIDETFLSLEHNNYRYSSPTGITAVELYDVVGNKINDVDFQIRHDKVRLDCSTLPGGAYVVIVYDNESNKFQARLIKQ